MQRLKDASERAAEVVTHLPMAKPLRDAVDALAAAANTARRQCPLLGNTFLVVQSLISMLRQRSPGFWTTAVGDGVIGISADASGLCAGVSFSLKSLANSHQRRSLGAMGDVWLSQALGRPTQVKQPASGRSTVSWSEGGTPVVARWQDDRLIKVRVGSAGPLPHR